MPVFNGLYYETVEDAIEALEKHLEEEKAGMPEGVKEKIREAAKASFERQ